MKVLVAIFFAVLSIQNASAVLNGSPAANHPSHAMILSFRQDNSQFPGGGTLISDRHVLTSAFNINQFIRWRVHMGANAFDRSTFMVDSQQALAHPEYNPNTRLNDIGVITLPNAVALTSFVRPISLPPVGSTVVLPLENEQGTIVGFGGASNQQPTMINNLMASFQRTMPNTEAQCLQIISNDVARAYCARDDHTPASNLCWGDQGAGFTIFQRNREVLVGIVSSGWCEQSPMSTYTRVTHFRTWIQTTTQV